MIQPGRKAHIQTFTSGKRGGTALLLAVLFLLGLGISWRGLNLWGATAYLLLWAASYVLIFAGTCLGEAS